MTNDRGKTKAELIAELAQLRQAKAQTDNSRIGLRLFRDLMDQSGDVLAIVDPRSGRLLDANKWMTKLLGYSHAELLEMTVPDFDTMIADKSVWASFVAELGPGGSTRLESVLRHQNGSEIPVEVSARLTADGDREFMVVISRDITERKRKETELQKSQAMHHTLLNATHDLVMMMDPAGTVVDLNEAAARSIQKRRDQLIGTNIFSHFPDPVAQTRRRQFEECLATGEAVHTQDERGGRSFDTTTYPILDDKGSVEFLAVFASDVTAHRATQGNLESERVFIEAALNASPDTFFVFDVSNGKPVRWNREFREVSGYRDAEIAAMTAPDDFYEEADLVVAQGALRDLATHGYARVDLPLLTKSGTKVPYEYAVTMIDLKDDSSSLACSIGRDITERLQAEEERHSLQAQVQHAQKLESLGVLAGGIAHDFNNLLMAIIGNCDIALLDLPPASPVRPSIQEVDNAARRAAELAKQMLAYSGQGHFVVSPLDLSGMVDEMAHLLESSISKKVNLNTDLGRELPAVNGDAAQIQQIIMNLITNASEAIPENEPGVIAVSTGMKECGKGYLARSYLDEKQDPGSYVFLEVTDTGSGMDEETRMSLFDPFFTTKFTGRGLGLAAVLGIVRGHKGAIMVDSKLGKGTTFRVLFPVAAGNILPISPTGEPALQDEWRGTGTVLIVDDEGPVRRTVTMMVKRLGFETLEAEDGHEAVEVFRENAESITCVLLDLTMPRMDGGEACLEIHQIRRDVPVVLSSGYEETSLLERFENHDMAAFIKKPYKLARLREILKSVHP